MRATIENHPRIRLVGEQVDDLAMPFRGSSKHLSERIELRTGVDPACWIVRRIHHYHSRSRANSGSNCLQVEVEALGREVHRDGYTCRAPDYCSIGKPARA